MFSKVTKVRSNYTYNFYVTNKDESAIIEAHNINVEMPAYVLSVPMSTLYKEEVSYILGREDWNSDKKTNYYKRDVDWNSFAGGDSPKLVSWWISSLPQPIDFWSLKIPKLRKRIRKEIEKNVNSLLRSGRELWRRYGHRDSSHRQLD